MSLCTEQSFEKKTNDLKGFVTPSQWNSMVAMHRTAETLKVKYLPLLELTY